MASVEDPAISLALSFNSRPAESACSFALCVPSKPDEAELEPLSVVLNVWSAIIGLPLGASLLMIVSVLGRFESGRDGRFRDVAQSLSDISCGVSYSLRSQP